ncbi:MAG: hypothetical protein HQK73_03820 [Desulfamplus sp.]|nr:hypothetical protein [Desulfamplus sp.]
MDTISNTVWQRKGSSVIFDQDSLAPFVKDEAVVSLREALSWMKKLPTTPPVKGKTIVVCGLETMIETLPEDEIDDFLTQRIRPLIIELQNRWTGNGLVFGFSSHPNTFEESAMQEEVLFKRRGNRIKVRLSEGLWDGSAAVNMKRIITSERESGQETIIGYYVARIS